jgi:hypothetical protein
MWMHHLAVNVTAKADSAGTEFEKLLRNVQDVWPKYEH